ncbi:hypothetical protein V8E36_005394 [Tilletia maclaganii]
MTGSSIRLRKQQQRHPLQQTLAQGRGDEHDSAEAETQAARPSNTIPPPQQQQQAPAQLVSPRPQRAALRLGSSSDDSDSDLEADDNLRAAAGSFTMIDRSTTPALPPPAPAQIHTAKDHLEQRRRKAEDDLKMVHARRIMEREIQPQRATSPRILPSPFLHHHHPHSQEHPHHTLSNLIRSSSANRARTVEHGHDSTLTTTHRRPRKRRPASVLSSDRYSRTRLPRRGIVATISARQRAASEKKEAHRRQRRLKRFRELDPLIQTGTLDDEAAKQKREKELEEAVTVQRELDRTLPGRQINGGTDAGDNHHNWEVVDTLDVVDPGVATVSTLTNVANSIVFPYIPGLFNRMPVVELPLESATNNDGSAPAATPKGRVKKKQTSLLEALRGKLRTTSKEALRDDSASLEEGRHRPDDSNIEPGSKDSLPQQSERKGMTRKQHRKARKLAKLREKQQQLQDPLDTHVETLLQNRKRAQLKRVMQGLWAFLKTPQGVIVGIYGFLVVFCGAALVIFLFGWIDHGNNKDFWVEVFSQAVNALFTLTGVGLIPWRARDTWRMAWIAYYQHKIWRLRQSANLPPLKDKNDLPNAEANATEVEERKSRLVVDGEQYGEGDAASEPQTPSEIAKLLAAGGPARTATPLQTIPESLSASSGLVLANAGSTPAPAIQSSTDTSHGPVPRTKTPISRVRSPLSQFRTASPFHDAPAGAASARRAQSPIPRTGTASPAHVPGTRTSQIQHEASELGSYRVPSPILRTASPLTPAAAAVLAALIDGPAAQPRPGLISWEPVQNPALGGPMGHFVEKGGAGPRAHLGAHGQAAQAPTRPGSAPPEHHGSHPGISPLREVGPSSSSTAANGDKSHAGTPRFTGTGGAIKTVPSRASAESRDTRFSVDGYFYPSRTSLDGGGTTTDGRSTVHFSQFFSAEEAAALQDIQVLPPKQAHRLHVLQTKFAHSASWYRPHETPTHFAFPISWALWITILNDLNSIFQCMLCGVMWGYATHYKDRPAWTTGTLIPCSFLCGIGAGVLIARGGKKTKKTDEVEQRLRAAFAERERAYNERRRRIEEGGDSDEDARDDEDSDAEDELYAKIAARAEASTSTSSSAKPTAFLSPIKPLAQRGIAQPLEDEDYPEDDVDRQAGPGADHFSPSSPQEADSFPLIRMGTSGFSSLQHFEDALAASSEDDTPGRRSEPNQHGLHHHASLETALSPTDERPGSALLLSPTGPPPPTSAAALEAAVEAIERSDEREEERTDAGVATAFFGLGGV